MTTSKTTVLGIRLDHERRGWIEAEAARQGLSIRAYFERMIDEARSVGRDPVEPAEPITRESVQSVPPVVHDDTAAEATTKAWSAREDDRISEPPPGPATGAPGLCDDLVSVVTISGRVLREAMEIPCTVVDVATRPFRRNRAR